MQFMLSTIMTMLIAPIASIYVIFEHGFWEGVSLFLLICLVQFLCAVVHKATVKPFIKKALDSDPLLKMMPMEGAHAAIMQSYEIRMIGNVMTAIYLVTASWIIYYFVS